MAKSKRAKATDISQRVKQRVWERDDGRCIFCNSREAMPNAHVISRAKGGLGVPENIVTACIYCHDLMDNSSDRKNYIQYANEWLDKFYPGRKREDLLYRKYKETKI